MSGAFLPRLRQAAEQYTATHEDVPPAVTCFLAAYDDYAQAIGPVMAFLQGKDLNLAYRIGSRAFCPEGPSFTGLQVRSALLEEAFGELVLQDRAKYLATLFLDDLLSVITTTIDRDFTLTDCAIWEYGRSLVGPDFGPPGCQASAGAIPDRLRATSLWTPILEVHRPDLVA